MPEPAEGQVLLRNLYVSFDPYMRGRMNDGPAGCAAYGPGEVMGGAEVSRAAASRHPEFAEGDLVLSAAGWQQFALSDGAGLRRLDRELDHPASALGVLGMPGYTAWHGLPAVGEPKAGETLVVAAASGAVGAVVGQVARIKGCRVVGIAGREDKRRHVVDELGFDAYLDHRGPDFGEKPKAAVPDGIDIYFENVGGAVFDAVPPLLNAHARVPVYGLIARYNDDTGPAQDGPDWLPALASVRPHIDEGRLVPVLEARSRPFDGFCLSYPRNRIAVPALRALTDVLKSQA